MPIEGAPDLAADDLARPVDLAVASPDAAVHPPPRRSRFGMPPVLDTDRPTTWIGAADLDGDGHTDLIAFERDPSQDAGLSIFGGRGDGTFEAKVGLYTGVIFDVAFGDFDGDGLLDLVVVGGSVGISKNPGAGFWPEPTWLGLGGGYQVAAGDLDGDGKLDLVTRDLQGVNVLLGDGAGGFQGPHPFAASGQQYLLALGDLDGDGDLDVVAGDDALLNDGHGKLGAAIPTGLVASSSVALGDFDGDGKLDLVAQGSDGMEPGLFVLLGGGDGTFHRNTPYCNRYTWDAAELATADLDGDGRLDLLQLSAEDGELWVRRGNGDGTFTSGEEYAPGPSAVGMALGDFDGDGRIDVAASSTVVPAISVLLNRGDGALPAPRVRRLLPACNASPDHLAAADLDGDGRPELLMNTPALSILHNLGGGSFADPVEVLGGDGISGFAAADLDGDGATDLVAGEGTRYDFLRGDGHGGFSPLQAVPSGMALACFAVHDFDGDGIPDLAAIAMPQTDSDPLWLYPRPLAPLTGMAVPPRQLAAQTWPSWLEVADLDGDGIVDLLASTPVQGRVQPGVLWGRAGGDFDPIQPIAVLVEMMSTVAIADFDADGKLDLALGNGDANWNTFSFALLRNLGGRTFAAPARFGTNPAAIAAGDLDGDGWPDVAAASWDGDYDGRSVILYYNDGQGGFAPSLHLPVGAREQELRLVDLDGDGRLDIAATSSGSGTLSLFFNR